LFRNRITLINSSIRKNGGSIRTTLIIITVVLLFSSSSFISGIEPLNEVESKYSLELQDCIDFEDIVLQYSFGVAVGSPGPQINLNNLTSETSCDIPTINTSSYNSDFWCPENIRPCNNEMVISLGEVRYLSLSEIFEHLGIDYSPLNGHEVDDITSDCLGLTCKTGIVEVFNEIEDWAGGSYYFEEFFEQEYYPQHGDRIWLHVYERDYFEHTYVYTNLPIDSECNPLSNFPMYVDSGKYVPIRCTHREGSDFVTNTNLYDFSNLLAGNNHEQEESQFLSFSGALINPEGNQNLTFESIRYLGGCKANVSEISSEGIINQIFEITLDSDFGVCDTAKLSFDESLIFIGGSEGVDPQSIIWDFRKGTYHTITGAKWYSFSWMHNSHDLVGVNDDGLVILNSSSGHQTLLISTDDLQPYTYEETTWTGNPYSFRTQTHSVLGMFQVGLKFSDRIGTTGGYHITFNTVDISPDYSSVSRNQSLYIFDQVGNVYFDYDSKSLKSGNVPTFQSTNMSYDIYHDQSLDTLNLRAYRSMLTSQEWIQCFSLNGNSDLDGDTITDFCDVDIDGDGVANELDNCPTYSTYFSSGEPMGTDTDGDGCLDGTFDADLDNDGIYDIDDLCPQGLANWSQWTVSSLDLPFFDFDNDGCHDILEDLDDDNDGVPDENDSCPHDETGSIDIDLDLMCEGEDDDDDGDNYTDFSEIECGSDANDSSSIPNDLDQDFLCDEVDPDIDGDNATDDLFPYNPLEWSDQDLDGFGDNSDDCIGNYGTSFADRKGCIDQDSDGVSDLNDPYPFDASKGGAENPSSQSYGSGTIFMGIFAFVIGAVLVVMFVRKRRQEIDVEEEELYDEDMSDYYNNSQIDREATQGPQIPDFTIHGELNDDGWEVLEYPSDSGNWWWKDSENECWQAWE
jgi:hypothetical protein